MLYLVLGPLAVKTASGITPVHGAKQTALLEILLAAQGSVVSNDRLTAELWGVSHPQPKLVALRAQILRLRQKMDEWEPTGRGGERLTWSGSGYALDVCPHETDIGQFFDKVKQGHDLRADPRKAIAVLCSALALWRVDDPTDALLSVFSNSTVERRLREARLQAIEDIALARMHCGEWALAVAGLTEAVEENPFHERFATLLMTVLAKLGRVAEVLDVYRRTQQRFIKEIGVDPSPQLSRHLDAILHHSDEKPSTIFPDADAVEWTREAPAKGNGKSMSTTTTRRRTAGTQAYERIIQLADEGSFVEFGRLAQHLANGLNSDQRQPAGDGVVTGVGRINGRPVAVFSQDSHDIGGSLGEMHGAKIRRTLDYSLRARIPAVGIVDSSGARIHEGVSTLDTYASIFHSSIKLSGRVPQINLILGPCAGGAAYTPALGDVVIMGSRQSAMYVAEPRTREAAHDDTAALDLGGPDVHAGLSGSVHMATVDTIEAFAFTRRILDYLPSSCWQAPPNTQGRPAGRLTSVPDDPDHTYDVRDVIHGIVDQDSFLEVHPYFAGNLVTAFARIDGESIGVVANQPCVLAGTLDSKSSEKGARFVRLCDAFGIPLLVLVDSPGFLPGRKEEASGIMRKGAKLLYAFTEASVPRVTVILRKAYGGAYMVMNSKGIGADAVYAWPKARLAVMGAEEAVEMIHRHELTSNPLGRPALVSTYPEFARSTEHAASCLSVDEILSPAQTRDTLAMTFSVLNSSTERRFRHDNQPQ